MKHNVGQSDIIYLNRLEQVYATSACLGNKYSLNFSSHLTWVLAYSAEPLTTIKETPEGDGWLWDQQDYRESKPDSDGVMGDFLNFMQMLKHNSEGSSMEALWHRDWKKRKLDIKWKEMEEKKRTKYSERMC